MNRHSIFLVMVLWLVSTMEVYSQTNDFSREWNFDSMDGWVYAHQDENPNNQCSIENGILKIYTRAGSKDRKKVRTKDKLYTTGRYVWRTYISDLGVGDQSSIGSWIYSDDHHEIDFEVGYGSKEVRDSLNAQSDDVVAYMTTQDNPYQSTQTLIKKGWHLFEIDITSVEGKYFVKWLIDGKIVSSVKQTFGSEVPFYIFCSVENLTFIGDKPAGKDNYGLFDYVKYEYHL